jgi:hypothetical protein
MVTECGCCAFWACKSPPVQKLKVAPQFSPFALVSTLKAINFDDEPRTSFSDWPKRKVLDLFSVGLSIIEGSGDGLRDKPRLFVEYPSSF